MNVKKIISVLLAMLIVTTSFSLLPVSASALETEETKETVITESGTTGDCTFAAEIDSESVELGVINLPDDEDAPNYPEIIKFENTNNGVMVYWTAFPGAESYRLFYWNGEKWRSVGSTSELSYLHKNVENGTTYLYTVRAEDEWGDYCSDFNRDGYENVYYVEEKSDSETQSYAEENGVIFEEDTENELGKKSGTTGDCIWELDEDGTLTISGDGDMEDYPHSGAPWKELSFTKVVIEDGVTNIGNHAFIRCKGLTNITIPASVKKIGIEPFGYCYNLTDVTIPDSVIKINKNAFFCCEKLTSVTIPKSVTSIGTGAFSGCVSINSINVDEENANYDSRNGCNAIIETKTNTLIQGCKNTVIDNSVTSIGENAFYLCDSLTSLIIPDSVTYIGSYAFWLCKGLTSLKISNNLTNISEGAFGGLYSLQSITIPESVTNIEYKGFSYCTKLTSITIPESVTNIGEEAFYWCSKLTSITISEGVTNIGKAAFGCCPSLTSITIPDSVTSIGNDAFSECESLTNIVVPDSVTSIGDDAFEWCTSLTSITIPNSVTSIGAYAFCECTSLKSIEIPKNLTSIGDYTFYGCTNLESLTIPSNVTSIGYYAFCGCTSLNSITIPSSVKSIGEHAFGYYYYYLSDHSSKYLRMHSDEYTKGEFKKIEDFAIRGKLRSQAQRYAEENGFTFLPNNFVWGVDNWSFNNESDNFKNITRDDTTIFGDVIEQFELSEIQKNNLKKWFDNESYKDAGMCFGMTISEILVNKGKIKLSEYDLDDILNNNEINTSTQLIISIIQGIFNTKYGDNYLQNLKLSTFNPVDYKQSDFLRNIETKLTNGNNLVMIGYKEGYKDSEKNNYHAVLGYGIEEGDYPYEGKNYNRKILIADPDYLSQNELKDEACIYYNSDYTSWVCPIRSYYWKDSDESSNAEIYDVLIDADPKDSPVGSGEGESENHYIAGISIYNKSGNQQTIEQVEGTGDPELNFTDGSGIARYYIDGGNRAELYALWNPTADYIVKYSTPSDYNMKMDYEHVTYYANVENGKSTLVKPEGSINIKGSDVNYSITMLTDDSERVTDWYALTVSGNNTDEVTLKKHENGYILSSDNLQNIELKAEKGDVEAVKTFSTTYNSVFIYEIDENTIGVKVDTDGDGTYETELSNVQNTYQIGDANLDGVVNVNDVTAIQYHLAELEPLKDNQLAFADVDGNGAFDINDATKLQKYLAGLTG